MSLKLQNNRFTISKSQDLKSTAKISLKNVRSLNIPSSKIALDILKGKINGNNLQDINFVRNSKAYLRIQAVEDIL